VYKLVVIDLQYFYEPKTSQLPVTRDELVFFGDRNFSNYSTSNVPVEDELWALFVKQWLLGMPAKTITSAIAGKPSGSSPVSTGSAWKPKYVQINNALTVSIVQYLIFNYLIIQ
jgi:hypothetical protein